MGDKSLSEFDATVRQLGQTLVTCIRDDLNGHRWRNALLDVRYDRTGSSWLSKIRVDVGDRTMRSVDVCTEIDLVLIKLNGMRRAFEHEWFGIKVRVNFEGHVEISYDYNPDCAEDATFFDD